MPCVHVIDAREVRAALSKQLRARQRFLPVVSHDPTATIAAMIDWSTCTAVERDPARVSGASVFRGTRVPVAALFENLEDGASVQKFVEWFPGVTLEQVRVVLEYAARNSLAVA